MFETGLNLFLLYKRKQEMLFGNGGNNKSASEASVAKETCEHDVSWEDVHGGDDLLDEYDYVLINPSDYNQNESIVSLYSLGGAGQLHDSNQQKNGPLSTSAMYGLTRHAKAQQLAAALKHGDVIKYYNQSFGHCGAVANGLDRPKNIGIKDYYKTATMNEMALKKQRKELAAFQNWSARMHTKLGLDGNRLQKHFRRQHLAY